MSAVRIRSLAVLLAVAGASVLAVPGPAVAKDAFCAKFLAIQTGMGVVDFEEITKHIPDLAKVAKLFKEAQSSAPAAIKTDFKTMSGVIQEVNAQVQKVKGLTEAQAKLAGLEASMQKLSDKVGYQKAATNVGKWYGTACK